MARRYFSSTAVATTLSALATNSTTSITVTTLTGFPNTTPWTAIISEDTAQEEVVEVTNVSGTTLTVTRGVDGTTAVQHSAGATFRHGVSGRDFDEANSHVNDTSTDVHSQYILKSEVTTKGDLIVASGSGAIDNLAAGTNERRLVADSGEALGLKYVPDTTNYAVAAKGDLLVGTAADTVTNVSVGTNGHVLMADSGQAAGVAWSAAPVTPVGVISPYAGSTAPTGWLLCDGSEVSSTTYPELAAVCGTTYGSASAGNFRLPDLRGRTAFGRDSTKTLFDTLGETGGSLTISTSQLPAHNHTATGSSDSQGSHNHTWSGSASTNSTGSHTHSFTALRNTNLGSGTTFSGGGTGNAVQKALSNDGTHTTGSGGDHSHTVTLSGSNTSSGSHSHNITVSVNNTGSGDEFVSPYIALNYIIKAA